MTKFFTISKNVDVDPSPRTRTQLKVRVILAHIQQDVKALMLSSSYQAKSYRSMYAFGNHVRVKNAQAQLTTMDFGLATTF